MIVRKAFFHRVQTFCPSMSISVFLVDQREVHGGASALLQPPSLLLLSIP